MTDGGSSRRANEDRWPTLRALANAMLTCAADQMTARYRGESGSSVESLAFQLDEAIWPGISRLAALIGDQTGREMDCRSIVEWAMPRLTMLASIPRDEGDGLAEYPSIREWLRPRLELIDRSTGDLPLGVVAEVLDGTPDFLCPKCWRRLEDRDVCPDGSRRWCDACRREGREACQATLGPLLFKAKLVDDHPYSREAFVKEVGPEIANLACDAFGFSSFTMATWTRLTQWLEGVHGLSEDKLAKTPRSTVLELLRGRLGPSPMDLGATDDEDENEGRESDDEGEIRPMQSPAEPIIPPSRRSIPMSAIQAARLFWVISSDQDAESRARSFRSMIKDGTIRTEKFGRQQNVFDINQFPESSRDKMLPKN